MIGQILRTIGRSCGMHPWRVAASWLVLLVAVTGCAAVAGGTLRDAIDVPGTSSARATAMLAAHFPAETGAEAHVVARSPGVLPTATVDRTVASLREVAHVRAVTPTISADGRSVMIEVRFGADMGSLDLKSTSDALTDAAAPLRATTAEVAVGGQIPEGVQGPNGVAEAVGVAVALVILVLVLGSLTAAGLPLLMAIIGIGVGTGLIGLLAAVTQVSTVSPTLGSMLGLGVGIDYSLLIIARFRDELVRGLSPLDAVVEAVATAGHAVTFAGICVLIGISGLAFSGIPSFTTMGMAAGLVVLATMSASITLLPALLVPLGHRVLSRRARPAAFRSKLAGRSTRAVLRRPVIALLLGLAALMAIAAPALDVRLGQNDAGSEPMSNPTRQAYDLIAAEFGPGWNGPLTVVADRSANDLVSRIEAMPGVSGIAGPVHSVDGTTTVLTVVPASGPQDEATYDLVRRLHRELPAGAELAGPTATTVDMTTTLQQRLWVVVLAVLAATLVLLTGLFRSPVLAVKAVLANLLSVGASFGALTWAFQTSAGAALLGLAHPVPIVAWAPVVLFAILFGLSTDYEVFLLSRVREVYDAGLPHRDSIVEGLASSAKVITCAAAIMIAVAAGFAADPSIMVKIIGVGMVVAILLDVTLVRLLVVPAVLALLGERTWWSPQWIRRMLRTANPRPRSTGSADGTDADQPRVRATP